MFLWWFFALPRQSSSLPGLTKPTVCQEVVCRYGLSCFVPDPPSNTLHSSVTLPQPGYYHDRPFVWIFEGSTATKADSYAVLNRFPTGLSQLPMAWTNPLPQSLIDADRTADAPIPVHYPFPACDVRVLREDRQGVLWIGTWNIGLMRLRNDQISVLTTNQGMASHQVEALHEDAEGTLWIGTSLGLCRLQAAEVERGNPQLAVNMSQYGFPNSRIHQVLEDDLENLWIGSEDGIFLRDSKRVDGRCHRTVSESGVSLIRSG